jgi:hypothetical protein
MPSCFHTVPRWADDQFSRSSYRRDVHIIAKRLVIVFDFPPLGRRQPLSTTEISYVPLLFHALVAQLICRNEVHRRSAVVGLLVLSGCGDESGGAAGAQVLQSIEITPSNPSLAAGTGANPISVTTTD